MVFLTQSIAARGRCIEVFSALKNVMFSASHLLVFAAREENSLRIEVGGDVFGLAHLNTNSAETGVCRGSQIFSSPQRLDHA